MKIQEKAAELFGRLWKSIAGFKVTMLMVVIWTIFQIICEVAAPCTTHFVAGGLGEVWRVCAVIRACAFLFAFSTLLCEIRFRENKTGWIVICLLSAVFSGIVSGLLSMIWVNERWGFNDNIIYAMPVSEAHVEIFAAGYILFMLSLIFYFSFRKSEYSFSIYLVEVFFRLLTAGTVWFVLSIGLALIFSVISSLLADLYSLLDVCQILSVGLCLIPGCIMALSFKKEQESDGTRNRIVYRFVIRYLLTCISICILWIGYLYLLKILFLQKTPSNEIFSIVAMLFCLGAPVWLMNECYKDDSTYSKAVSLLPYFFAPLICLQIWSLGLRIGQYGLTQDRYAGIMLIVFEISFVVVWKWYRADSERLLLIAAVLIAVSCFMPFLNMYSFSVRNQRHVLETYVRMDRDLSGDDYTRFKGAYYYLEHLGELDDEEREQCGTLLEEAKKIQETQKKKSHYIHGCQMVGELDTEGYRRFYMLNQDERYTVGYQKESVDVDFAHFSMVKRKTGEAVEIDLKEVYEKALAYELQNPDADKDEVSGYLKQLNKIVVDENTVFYLNHFQIDFYTQDDQVTEITNINISGMLLEK